MNSSYLARIKEGFAHLHTTISGLVVAIFGFAALIANSPESLNLDVFPPDVKSKVVVWCGMLASIAFVYKSLLTQQAGGANQVLSPLKTSAAKTVIVLFLAVLAFGVMAGTVACVGDKPATAPATIQAKVVTTAAEVPAPSAALAVKIRADVATAIKAEVQKHPQIAAWCNELAKLCFRFSTTHLPSVSILKAGFAAVQMVAPADIVKPITPAIADVLKVYSDNHDALAAVQNAGTPWLTIIGEGIQDGVAASGVTEAP